MTPKADVILNAAENGASDEHLLVLEDTDESEFVVEVKEETQVEKDKKKFKKDLIERGLSEGEISRELARFDTEHYILKKKTDPKNILLG